MVEIILLALVIYLLQLMSPSLVGLLNGTLNAGFLFSARDETVVESAVAQRLRRASVNMGESMTAFLVLSVLSIMGDINNTEMATLWIGTRLAYVLAYGFGIAYLRTLIWFGSVYCLVMMALSVM
jgi:uncharacterized MAPEG superfamily protein